MKFVVDAPLPPALARWLRSKGHDAQAVRDLNLRDSADGLIWDHAARNGCVIVAKDEDFANLALQGDGPPVLWVRIGNSINPVLFARFEAAWPQILALLDSGARIVELR